MRKSKAREISACALMHGCSYEIIRECVGFESLHVLTNFECDVDQLGEQVLAISWGLA